MRAEIHLEKDLQGYTLIVGFPGIGLVGPIVAKHIVESRNMEIVGEITSPLFPAVASIKGGLAIPPVRIYADETKKIAVVVSEIMFSEDSAKEVGRAIIDAAEKAGVKRIISIAGVIIPSAPENVIYGVGGTQEDVRFLMRYGVKLVEKGVTTGISAVLLTESRKRSVPVVLLLGTLRAKEDFRAAAEIIRKIDEMLGLEIPYEDLLERAQEIEREISSIVNHAKRESPMYG